jgi:hypothetical protein
MWKTGVKEKQQQTIGMPNTISRISNHLIVVRSWSAFTAHVYNVPAVNVFSQNTVGKILVSSVSPLTSNER